MHAIGDRATLENCSSFLSSLYEKSMSVEEGFDASDVFADASHNMSFWLGDWHAVMNMLQSIHKIYWDTFFGPLTPLLGW